MTKKDKAESFIFNTNQFEWCSEYWEIEDIGVHAHIKVRGSDDDMIGLGFPLPLAKIIVDRHNKALDALIECP